MSKDGESAVTAEMRQWSCQCNSIRVGLALGSPTKYHNFSKGRLDGIMGLSADYLTDGWYEDMLVSVRIRCSVLDILLVSIHLYIYLHN